MVGWIDRILYRLSIFFSDVASFFAHKMYLHTASFATPQKLKSLVSDTLAGTTILIGETMFRHILKVSPTKKQKELLHYFFVGRSRSGKGLAIESNLLNWEFPAIVNDIKRELSRRTAGFREKGLGGINYFFDPSGRGNKFDPLAGMTTDSELQSASTILLYRPNERENQIFTDRAITMLTQIFHAGLLEGQRLLPFTQKIIFEGLYGAAAILEIISRQHNVYPNLATRFLDVDFRHADFKDKFLLDCWGTMSNRMNRLLTKESVRCFTGSDFTGKDIITSEKPITVYLCWPEKDLLSLSPLVHLVWTSLMDGMLSAYDDVQEGRIKATCYPVLAVLDEIGRTGFPNLPEYSTTVAGRNISLLIAVQSIAQLDAIYGVKKADVLRDNMDTQIFYRPTSLATAEYIERKLGYKSGFAHSKTDHEGGVSRGESEQRVPVMTVQQIMQMGDEEIIGWHKDLPPFHEKRMDWRRFPLLAKRHSWPMTPPTPLPPATLKAKAIQKRNYSPLASWHLDPNLHNWFKSDRDTDDQEHNPVTMP